MTKGRAMLPFAPVGWWREQQVPIRLRSGQALHFAPPDFLWNLLASANFMRLSLRKGAHAALSSAVWQEIRVRSGRDDNSYFGKDASAQGKLLSRKQSQALGMTKGKGRASIESSHEQRPFFIPLGGSEAHQYVVGGLHTLCRINRFNPYRDMRESPDIVSSLIQEF
jgi:hypothetical protein